VEVKKQEREPRRVIVIGEDEPEEEPNGNVSEVVTIYF
jgi:hypothetical protein